MIKIYRHGHSFVQMQSQQFSILIDPFCVDGCKFEISEDIKFIILTHGHSDHIGKTLEIAQKTGCKIISMPEICKYFKSKGIQNTHGMNIGGEHDFGSFSIKLVNAVHSGAIEDSGLYCSPCGVLVRIEGKNIYHAGDTGLMYDMKLLGEYENIDLAFLPIGDNFTMGVKDAVIATDFIRPKTVVPMHYDSFEVIKSDPQEFAKQIMLNNFSIPKILDIGQYIIL